MLYGGGEEVMRHLQQCLILGYVLRYQLTPWLAAQGITMQNILFKVPGRQMCLETLAFFLMQV